MKRQIELVEDTTGTRVVADLLWDSAPATCAAIWASLETPISTVATHSSLAGRAVIVDIPERNRTFDAQSLPRENETVTPLPGEIGFRFYPPNTFADPQRPDEADGSTSYWMMTLAYGRDVRFFTLAGWEPTSVFARVTDGLEAFGRLGELIRSGGSRILTIRRGELESSKETLTAATVSG
jgi:uncharacterized protein DUF3830